VESSKVIDLEKFAPRNDIDPVYFDSSFYLHPDGPIAVEGGEMVEATLRVVDDNLAYTGVHATRGKVVRAEPVAALYLGFTRYFRS
jgi:non-homologous end joining protein Ku